jgi:TRAP-type mannitol/chloroaromatic compound transport system permease large subunit
MSLAMLITMLVCFALSISIAVSIGLSAILGIQIANANMLISVKEMFNSINKFPLAAIPFFILAGNLMETAFPNGSSNFLKVFWAASKVACP